MKEWTRVLWLGVSFGAGMLSMYLLRERKPHDPELNVVYMGPTARDSTERTIISRRGRKLLDLEYSGGEFVSLVLVPPESEWRCTYFGARHPGFKVLAAKCTSPEGAASGNPSDLLELYSGELPTFSQRIVMGPPRQVMRADLQWREEK